VPEPDKEPFERAKGKGKVGPVLN